MTLIWLLKVIKVQRSWGTLRCHIWLPICVSNVFLITLTCFVYEKQPPENSPERPWGNLNGHMRLTTICTNIYHTIYSLWDATCWKLCDLYLTFNGHIRSEVLVQTERLYMTMYMWFIETFVMACIVSDILAPIDHKGHNWTFLNLTMTFRVIPHL